MNTPCEVLVEANDPEAVHAVSQVAADEAWRIEEKFSRFRPDSVIGKINASSGTPCSLDDETRALLEFADQCWRLSDGLIDITVGIYFRHWKFDATSPPPDPDVLREVSDLVGWDKVELDGHRLRLQPGMSLDLGGIGKEYAVDRIASLLRYRREVGGVLVNLGGDIAVSRRRRWGGDAWEIAIEEDTGGVRGVVRLVDGAVATSGNTKRYAVDASGAKLGHVLDPRTGWPVPDGPAAVTVVADTATQAGLLSTISMLKGRDAERFLQEQGVEYLCQW